jgi:FAD/FMN-containing dehydrogenase
MSQAVARNRGERTLANAARAEHIIQWRVKQALDPQNILNPGKVLPEP